MTAPALRARHLRREFGPRVAVDDVSLLIEPGEILSLLGPNGAGKTTTVRICATLLTPHSGTIEIAGTDAIDRPREARRLTGLVLGGERGFYGRATAANNLLFFADIAGVSRSCRVRRVTAALDAVQLTERSNDQVRSFSRGMLQRLHLARALVSAPRLLLLDEPTAGLDPHIARDVRSLVRAIADDGVGVLLTSHHMGEVEQLADRVHVIVGGREAASGSVEQIAWESGASQVTTFSAARYPDGLVAALDHAAVSVEVVDRDGRWHVRIAWREEARTALVDAWRGAQPPDDAPSDLSTRPATLEEGYLALVGRHA